MPLLAIWLPHTISPVTLVYCFVALYALYLGMAFAVWFLVWLLYEWRNLKNISNLLLQFSLLQGFLLLFQRPNRTGRCGRHPLFNFTRLYSLKLFHGNLFHCNSYYLWTGIPPHCPSAVFLSLPLSCLGSLTLWARSVLRSKLWRVTTTLPVIVPSLSVSLLVEIFIVDELFLLHGNQAPIRMERDARGTRLYFYFLLVVSVLTCDWQLERSGRSLSPPTKYSCGRLWFKKWNRFCATILDFSSLRSKQTNTLHKTVQIRFIMACVVLIPYFMWGNFFPWYFRREGTSTTHYFLNLVSP